MYQSKIENRKTKIAAIALFALCCAAPTLAADPPRRIYVPLSDLDAVIDRDHGGVMLTQQEYAELERAARAGASGPEHLPAGAVLSQADYTARISGDQLLVSVNATVTDFRPGWSRVILPAAGAGVESATLDGQPARLARDPDHPTSLVLYVAETGEHKLALELSLPLTAVGGERVAALELLGAPTGVLAITLPAGKHLTVNGAQPERPAPIDAAAAYAIPVGGLKAIRLRITDRAATAAGDALSFAQSALGVYVAPGEITWTARTSLQVYGRTIDTLVCTVPKSLELTAVESSGLESWELAADTDAPDRTRITLHYRQTWDGAREITFRGIVAAPAGGAWSVPDLTIREVTSHVGRAVVQFPPGVRLQMVDAVGVRPVLAADGMDPSAPSLEYEIWQEAFRLSFLTAAKEREVHAAMTTLVDVNADGLDLSVTLDARTLFAPLFDLQLRIPADWTVRSATAAGAPIDWQIVPAEAGINQVRIPLNPPLAENESRTFTLVAHRDPEGWPVEQTPIRIALPEVRLPQVGVLEALYGISVDDDLDALPVDVTGLDPARQDDVDLLNGKLRAFGKSIRLGYTFQDTVFSGQLDVSRRPSRIAASTAIFFRTDRQSLFGHLESTIDVSGGGIRELKVSVSESAGTDLRFRLWQPVTANDGRLAYVMHSARIVEQVPGDVQDGLRPWTLRFDQRVRGQCLLMVDVQTTLPADANPPATGETFAPFVLTIPAAERETGHIAIESNGEQHVQVTSTDATGVALPTVDPVDFPPALYRPVERVVAGFRYAQPGWTMSITRTQYNREPVPTAVIHTAKLTSVIAETGEMQNQADYSFTAIGVQSLRLRLVQNDDGQPPELWAVQINGQPVEVRTSANGQLIAIPPADSPQQSRELRISYRTKVSPLIESSGRLHQTPPQLAAVTGAGDEQPLEVLDQRWIVYHAKGTLLVDSNGRFHPSSELDRDSFLGRIEQLFRAPSPREFGMGVAAVLGAIAAVWVLSLGFQHPRSIGIGAILALLAVCGVLFMLMMPAVQQAREAAQRTSVQNNFRQEGLARHDFAAPTSAASAEQSWPMAGEALLQAESADGVPGSLSGKVQEGRINLNQSRLHGLEAGANSKPPIISGFAIEPSTSPAAGGALNPLAPFGAVDPINPPKSERNSVESAPAQQRSDVGTDTLSVTEMDASSERVLIRQMPKIDADGDAVSPTLSLGIAQSQAPVGLGALLSLTFDLQPPPDYVARDFTYHGDANDDAPADLNLTYTSRRAGRTLTFAMAAAAVLLCWIIRAWSFGDRMLLAAALLIVPLALTTIAPVAFLPFLDGLLLGGVIGLALWALRALIDCCADDLAKSRAAKTAGSLLVLALFLGGSGSSALADEKQPPGGGPPAAQPAAEAMVVPHVEPTYAAGVTGPTPADAKPPAGIIIPYDDGTNPLASQRVFLSHEQFLELWNRAHPEQQLPATAPVDGLVSEALYAATLAGADDAARIAVTARFIVHNFRTQQITLPLPLKQVALTSSTLDGAPAAVQVTGDCLSIVLPASGTHILDLAFTLPARVAGPAGEFTLPLLPVPAARLDFTLPAGEDLLVSVAGAATTYRIREQDGAKHVETPVDQGGDVTLAWRPKTMRGDAGTVVHVESTVALLAGDAGLTHSHALVYRVRQGAVSEVAFRAPLGLRLKRIAGPDVGGWELSDQGDARLFRVFLRRAVDNETSIILEFHQPLSVTDQPQTLPLPEITLDNVTRETGTIGIYAPEHFVVRATAAAAQQINAGTFSAPLLGGLPAEAPRLAFRYSLRPVGLELTVSRRQPETRAAAEHGVRVELRKLHIASRVRFELTGAPRLALSFRLPAGYLPLDVQAQYLADWYVSGEGDARALTIELDQPRTGAIEVVLNGHIQRQPNGASATIDVPQPLSVSRMQSQLAVWLDASYTAVLAEFGQWKSVDPGALADTVRALNPRPPQFAFQSTAAAPGTVAVSLTRATPQLTAESITLAAVSETSIDYGLTLRWKIRQAAADTFVVVTPGWLKGRLDWTGAGIRSTTSADLPDGRIRWTIALVDPVEAEYLLTGVATLPPPADLLVAVPDVQFEQPVDGGAFSPLGTQSQFAVLVNLSGWQMSPVDPALVDSIARDELPFELRGELLTQAMEILRIAAGKAPSWKLERLAQVASADATVTAAEMRTVLDYDGSWRLRALYTVRNRGRQFLALNIPENARVLSVFVRGAPSRTVLTTLNNSPVHLVALPQTSISDLSFDIELVLAGRLPSPLPEGFRLTSSEVELPAPTVVTSEQAKTGNRADLGTPVIHTQWTVELPDGIDATIIDDVAHTNVSPEEGSWLLQISRAEADIADLVKVLDNPYNSALQRKQAVNNLKQLNLALQNNQGRAVDLKGGTEEYFRRNSELQQQAESKVRDFEARNGSAEVFDSSDLAPAKDAGRSYILSNSMQIADDNRDAGAKGGEEQAKSEGLMFNFQLNEAAPESRKSADDKAMSKRGSGRGELRQQLKEQSVDEVENLARRAQPQSQSQDAKSRSYFGVHQDTEWSTTHNIRGGEMDLPRNWHDLAERAKISTGTSGQNGFSDMVLDGQSLQALGYVGAREAGAQQAAAAPAWSSAGGLSLQIALPQAGHELRFDKVGGDPKLTLSIRPRRTLTLLVGAVWTVVCLVGGLWLVRAALRHENGRAWHAVPKAAMAVGVLGFFLIPGAIHWLLFAVFVAAAFAYAIQRRQAALADEE